MAHPHVGAGVRVSLSRLRPRSIDKQYTSYKLRSRNKQRTKSLFLCALSDGSPCYLSNDLRLELFQRGRWRKSLVRKAAPLPLKRSPRSTRAQPLARLGICKRG